MKNRLMFGFIFMCLGVIGLAAISTDAQGIGDRNMANNGGSHNIIGKVYLPDGTPAVGVKVSVSGADFTNTSTRTDNDGAFIFGSIPGGNYEISVTEKGYERESETMTIERFASSGQGYQMSLHLRPLGQPKTPTGYAANPLFKDVPKDAMSKFEKGMEKMAKNDASGAVSFFDGAIASHPKFAAAYYEKGSAYLKLNDADKATEAFVGAINIKQDYLEAKYGYGLAQFQKKNYEVAAAAFGDVLQSKKDMAEAHMNLGISLFYLKNFGAAESELKTAIATKGGENLALPHLYLGQIYTQKKKNSDAVTELQKYIDLAPKAPNVDRIKSAIADLKKQS